MLNKQSVVSQRLLTSQAYHHPCKFVKPYSRQLLEFIECLLQLIDYNWSCFSGKTCWDLHADFFLPHLHARRHFLHWIPGVSNQSYSRLFPSYCGNCCSRKADLRLVARLVVDSSRWHVLQEFMVDVYMQYRFGHVEETRQRADPHVGRCLWVVRRAEQQQSQLDIKQKKCRMLSWIEMSIAGGTAEGFCRRQWRLVLKLAAGWWWQTMKLDPLRVLWII